MGLVTSPRQGILVNKEPEGRLYPPGVFTDREFPTTRLPMRRTNSVPSDLLKLTTLGRTFTGSKDLKKPDRASPR